MQDHAVATTSEGSKRAMLDDAVQRITNLAIEVDNHAVGLERVLMGGGAVGVEPPAPEPEGYVDAALAKYAVIENSLDHANSALVRMDEALRERPRDAVR